MASRLHRDLVLRINLALAIISGLLTLWHMTREPSEAQAAIIGGFSLPRVLILLVIILFLSLYIWLFLYSFHRNFWSTWSGNFISRILFWKALPIILLLLLVFLYLILLSSPQLLGKFSSYRERLFPLLFWIAFFILQVFITLLILRWSETSPLKLFLDQFRGALIAFGILGLLVLFIHWSRVGLTPDAVYWMEPGTPLLIQQVLVAVGIGVIFFILQAQDDSFLKHLPSFLQRLFSSKLFLCLVIWGVASTIWLSQPLRPAYNSLEPRPPNFQNYPFGDAMFYDIHAQSVLIGKQIPSHFWVKPLYTLFLSFLHVLAGQDYALIVSLQVIVLAIIPVLGFLIVDTMGSRTAGLVTALLLIFREQNAIALSNVIQVSNSKFLMSDVFSMGLMALLTFLLVRWSKNPVGYQILLFAAGGILGLLVLTRGNPIVLLPFLVLFVLSVVFIQKKFYLWREGLLLLLLGFIIPLAPWFFRNYQLTGKLTFQNAPKAFTGQLANLYNLDPSTDYGDKLSSGLSVDQENEKQSQILQYILQHPGDVIQFVSAHYFHNLVFSYIYLPQSFQIENLRSYTKSMPFWGAWEGYLPGGTRILLFINLGILALGVSALWKKNHAFVLAPVLLALGYNLSVSVVRLSGWRLILPFDWLMLIFYSMGLVQLVIVLSSVFAGRQLQGDVTQDSKQENISLNWRKLTLLGLVFVGIGLGVTTVNTFFQSQYVEKSTPQLLGDYEEISSQIHSVLSLKELQNFVDADGAIVIDGRALFPTFLPAGSGFQSVIAPAFDEQPFSRLAFYVTGSQGISGSIQLDSLPKEFPDFTDILVFGCHAEGRWGDYIDVLTIVLKTEPATIYVRSSMPENLTCPLPPP